MHSLYRTSIPIVHPGGKFPAKVLFTIVSGIIAGKINWVNGFESKTFLVNHRLLDGAKSLDCGLAVSGSYFDFYEGSLTAGASDQALAYFIFRLLQKLQSLGTVPAVDWNSYAFALGG